MTGKMETDSLSSSWSLAYLYWNMWWHNGITRAHHLLTWQTVPLRWRGVCSKLCVLFHFISTFSTSSVLRWVFHYTLMLVIKKHTTLKGQISANSPFFSTSLFTIRLMCVRQTADGAVSVCLTPFWWCCQSPLQTLHEWACWWIRNEVGFGTCLCDTP